MPILTILYSSGSSTLPEIAEQLDLDRSTLSRNLGVLSKRNLLTLSGGRGRLPASVQLTPAGTEVFRAALKAWNEAQEELQEIGPLRELLAALDTVERFAENLQ
jgi:DNA-binding MarR family transcriptional regulator